MLAFLLGMDHADSGIEFEDIGEIIPEALSFEEAEKLFLMRIPMTKKEWEELEPKLRFRAFVVGRLTELDAIESVRVRVLKALKEGKTLQEFWQETGKDELLKRAGFHRSNPWYWETVFRTNIQSAYNAGRAYQFRKAPPTYYEFVGITDARQTPTCRARSGIIRPSNDPFWITNWPPLHFNCRSTVRAVHKEEYEGLGLKVTGELPQDIPPKGFGVYPLDSGSYWKLTPQMIERAKKYGIYDDIKKAAEELGLDLKHIKMPKPSKQKQDLLINKYEYNSLSDVEKYLKDFSETYKEYFRSGFAGLRETKEEYFMATNPANGMFYISRLPYGSFLPAKDLVRAFSKIKNKLPLTFDEEYAIEALWHEINHNRVKRYVKFLQESSQMYLMETINQLVSRHTYEDFLKKIGAEARHKEEILQKGYGYRLMVKNFRHLLSRVGFKEEKIVKELEKILFEDYGTLFEKVVALIAKKAKLPEAKVRKILDKLNDEQEFKKLMEASLAKAK